MIIILIICLRAILQGSLSLQELYTFRFPQTEYSRSWGSSRYSLPHLTGAVQLSHFLAIGITRKYRRSFSSPANFFVVTDIFLLKNSATPPRASRAPACTTQKKIISGERDSFRSFALCTLQGSNLRPPQCKWGALPTELRVRPRTIAYLGLFINQLFHFHRFYATINTYEYGFAGWMCYIWSSPAGYVSWFY